MYTSIYVQISGNMWRGKGLRVLRLLVGFAVLVVRTSQVGVGKEHGIVRSKRLEANNCKAGKRVHAEEIAEHQKDAEIPRQRSEARPAVGQVEIGQGFVGSLHHDNLLMFSRRVEDEHNPRIGDRQHGEDLSEKARPLHVVDRVVIAVVLRVALEVASNGVPLGAIGKTDGVEGHQFIVVVDFADLYNKRMLSLLTVIGRVAIGKRFSGAFSAIVLVETSAPEKEQSRINAPKSEGEGNGEFHDHAWL